MSHSKALTATCACGLKILIGLDAGAAAFTVTVDLAHLTRDGELLAVIVGRRTYRLDSSHRLHRRDKWHLRTPPTQVILSEHLCGEPIPNLWRKAPDMKTRKVYESAVLPF